MTKTQSEERKYDLCYYAECFAHDMTSRRTLLRARTIGDAKEEVERRFPLHAPGDMLRILGVVRSGMYPENRPVAVAERVFPKGWMESDEARWFRTVEEEAELLDGVATRKRKRRIPPVQLQYIAGALGVGEHRIAALIPDYGDVISETIRVKLMTCANAARFLNISRGRLDQLRRTGRFGEAIRFSGRYFLLRASVEAFAERRMRYRGYWENLARMRRERLAERASG